MAFFVAVLTTGELLFFYFIFFIFYFILFFFLVSFYKIILWSCSLSSTLIPLTFLSCQLEVKMSCIHSYEICYWLDEICSNAHDVCACVFSHFSCVQLCYPVNCDPPGSFVHGILQARTLEWIDMPSSRGSFWPRDRTCISYVSCIVSQVLDH